MYISAAFYIYVYIRGLTLSLFHTLSHSHSLSLKHSLSLSLSLSHTRTLSHTHTYTHTHTLSLSLSLSLSGQVTLSQVIVVGTMSALTHSLLAQVLNPPPTPRAKAVGLCLGS